jgi:hypothetical protein
MNIFLSSEELTNLFYSIKVRVLIAPRCWLYSIVLEQVLKSNCKIFRLLDPTKKIFGWCSEGWNFKVNGIPFRLNVETAKLLKIYLFRIMYSNIRLCCQNLHSKNFCHCGKIVHLLRLLHVHSRYGHMFYFLRYQTNGPFLN